jgi:multidrug efflux pump subunit AcrB
MRVVCRRPPMTRVSPSRRRALVDARRVRKVGMVLRVDVDQNRARQFGVSSQDIATVLDNVVGGSSVTQVYDSIYIVNVVARADKAEREAVETFQALSIAGRDGQPVPLPAIANIEFQIEQPIVWRRNRQPTVTLQAPVLGDLQPATVVQQLKPAVAKSSPRFPWATRSRLAARSRKAARASGRSPM